MTRAILTFVAFLAIQFVGANVVHGRGKLAELAVYATASLALVVATFVTRGVRRAIGPWTPRFALFAIPIGVGIGAFAITYARLAKPFGIEMNTANDLPLAVGFLAYVVVAPISEELFFRGWIQPVIAEETSQSFARLAPVVTAILFMLVHEPASYAPSLLVGLAAGLLRRRTHSVIPGIIVHALSNALILFYFR